ncbi:MAG: CBS domain-containing protein [Gemmatimonadetes bacterium]|nr:CBS domain-containing protein [Gemmatimonadota bacterium]NIR79772.1 CBS domain-containing protein [Gemmatimonadota bacterium]NIT88468.1 CBS domain-containing protein [Gemmatimonadota bacterium]NIU32291.1 CBS domain-containing protein [Gemmatimonadota bacterium]NIU36828.1 CBS domain-containing protein [Gemmatimonadota bacterium]
MKTVREIMQAEVVTVEPETSMLELSRILTEAGIGGAPVVDRSGALVGVISGTDVLRLASGDAEAAVDLYPFDPVSALDPHASSSGDPTWFYLGPERPGTAAQVAPGEILGGSLLKHTVGDVMSGERYAVPPDMSVEGLARFLLEKRIHRALVSDGTGLLGIVTTYDVLRAVASGTGAETAA